MRTPAVAGWRIAAGLVLAGMTCAPAAAQDSPAPAGARIAADTVASSDAWVEHEGAETGAALDLLGAWRVTGALDVLARPVFRRDHEGDWHADVYQLAVRYGRGRQLRWRLEAGYLPSPIGVSPLESRADVNPLIAPVTAYTAWLPAIEGGTPPTQLASPLYPLAAQVTVSSTRWDARAAVLESSLVRVRPLTGPDKPPRAPQLALGGGVTPRVGLRLGGSFAHGRYARADEVADRRSGDRFATILGADADWAVGYTRVYADAVRTRFDRADGDAVASAVTVTGVRTLAPRWFLAGRVQRLTTSHRVEAAEVPGPAYGHGYDSGYGGHGGGYGGHTPAAPAWVDRGGASALGLETALGYRLTPEVTIRAGYLGYRGFDDDAVEHHATCSIVWARRWW
jgi:hypothetical protein